MFNGKISTIFMVIFNSYVTNYQRVVEMMMVLEPFGIKTIAMENPPFIDVPMKNKTLFMGHFQWLWYIWYWVMPTMR